MSFFNFLFFYERIHAKNLIILIININLKNITFFSNSTGLFLPYFYYRAPSKPLLGSFLNIFSTFPVSGSSSSSGLSFYKLL